MANSLQNWWNTLRAALSLSPEPDDVQGFRTLPGAVRSFSAIYAQKDEEDLGLDWYQPAEETAAPEFLVLFVHGGGFSEGRRDDPRYVQFARKLAQRGIWVMSLSYRLSMKGRSFGCDQQASVKAETFRKAAEDIWDATAYALQYVESAGIPVPRIVLCGSSAGAEAVLHAAFWPEPALPAGFRYAAVVGMAPAIMHLEWITRENAIPSLLFHGVDDPLVPYGSASHHYCSPDQPGYLMLHGAGSIAARLRALEKPYQLVRGLNGGHGWADKPLFDYLDAFFRFLHLYVRENRFLKEESEIWWK
ncbi:MAG: alpha/beta hydrolase [Haliscomenobacter sp.]|nr:alpha/beta hydrolase [Haliscomenobacter sp.]